MSQQNRPPLYVLAASFFPFLLILVLLVPLIVGELFAFLFESTISKVKTMLSVLSDGINWWFKKLG